MRAQYLLIWLLKVTFEKELKVFKIADLRSDLKTFAISSSTLIKHLHSLVGMFNCLIEDQVCTNRKTCSPLARLAMDSYHTLWVACQIKHRIQNQLKDFVNGAWIVVHEREVR